MKRHQLFMVLSSFLLTPLTLFANAEEEKHSFHLESKAYLEVLTENTKKENVSKDMENAKFSLDQLRLTFQGPIAKEFTYKLRLDLSEDLWERNFAYIEHMLTDSIQIKLGRFYFKTGTLEQYDFVYEILPYHISIHQEGMPLFENGMQVALDLEDHKLSLQLVNANNYDNSERKEEISLRNFAASLNYRGDFLGGVLSPSATIAMVPQIPIKEDGSSTYNDHVSRMYYSLGILSQLGDLELALDLNYQSQPKYGLGTRTSINKFTGMNANLLIQFFDRDLSSVDLAPYTKISYTDRESKNTEKETELEASLGSEFGDEDRDVKYFINYTYNSRKKEDKTNSETTEKSSHSLELGATLNL